MTDTYYCATCGVKYATWQAFKADHGNIGIVQHTHMSVRLAVDMGYITLGPDTDAEIGEVDDQSPTLP